MTSHYKPATISLVALSVGIGSAVVASDPQMVGEGWEGMRRAVWITMLITLPACAVFVAAGIAAVMVRHRTRNTASVSKPAPKSTAPKSKRAKTTKKKAK